MRTVYKAVLASAITVAPVLIKQYAKSPWDMPVILAYMAMVFLASQKFFKPDERFLRVREPTLDSAFAASFRDDLEHPVKEGVDPPFRVHIFCKSGIGPKATLRVKYSYNSQPSLPDHGSVWPRGTGLVWKAYQSGLPLFSMNGDSQWQECNLNNDQEAKTSHVCAVLIIPLRRPVEKEKEAVSSKVTALLAFDALTEESAQVLKNHADRLRDGNHKKLLDRSSFVSLYF